MTAPLHIYIYICIYIFFSSLDELVDRKKPEIPGVRVCWSSYKTGRNLNSFFGSGFGLYYRTYIIKLNFLVTDFDFSS